MEKEKRICEICGKEFLPKSKNQKMCSDICRDYKTFKSRKSFRGETLEEFIKKMSHPCSRCGGNFYKKELSRVIGLRYEDKYCRECEKILKKEREDKEREAQRERERIREEDEMRNRKVCPVCNTIFSHPYYKYCSLDCWKTEQRRGVAIRMNVKEMKNILDKVFKKEQQGECIETIFITKDLILFQNKNGDDTVTERDCDKEDYRLWIK